MAVTPDRDASRNAHGIGGLQSLVEGRDGRVELVGDERPVHHAGAGALGLRGEGEGIRVADLAGSERTTGLDELVAGDDHGHPRARAAQDLRPSQRGQHRHLGGPQVYAGRQDALAGTHILPGPPGVVARETLGYQHELPPGFGRSGPVDGLGSLDRDDGFGALGHHGTRRDPHRLPGAQRPVRGLAGARLPDHLELGRLPSDDGEPVHGRRVERGEGSVARHVLGEDPPER